jgi:hypothetical protein
VFVYLKPFQLLKLLARKGWKTFLHKLTYTYIKLGQFISGLAYKYKTIFLRLARDKHYSFSHGAQAKNKSLITLAPGEF